VPQEYACQHLLSMVSVLNRSKFFAFNDITDVLISKVAAAVSPGYVCITLITKQLLILANLMQKLLIVRLEIICGQSFYQNLMNTFKCIMDQPDEQMYYH